MVPSFINNAARKWPMVLATGQFERTDVGGKSAAKDLPLISVEVSQTMPNKPRSNVTVSPTFPPGTLLSHSRFAH